jgi:hypothetical protein
MSPRKPHWTSDPKALRSEYLKLSARKQIVRVDSQGHQIEIKPHPLVELWRRAQKFIIGKK